MNYVNTSLLRVGFEEHNADASECIVLVHGWPDSIRTWDKVLPYLVKAGYRVIVPALRGFNPTTFLNPKTPRTGQLASLGVDLLEFLDALKLEKPILVGHDWGARAVSNACALKEACARAMVIISVGYATNSANQSLSIQQSKKYWYHWFMATPRGQETVKNKVLAKEFTKSLWSDWSPGEWFTEQEFEQVASYFDNPDWAQVTLDSYTQRWGHAPKDPYYDWAEARLHPPPTLSLPTLMLHGESDGATHPETSAGKEHFFKGVYERIVIPNVGHFVQRECAEFTAQKILEFVRMS
jgi:pimeloyl-ACP methyl ester carboxylesterase